MTKKQKQSENLEFLMWLDGVVESKMTPNQYFEFIETHTVQERMRLISLLRLYKREVEEYLDRTIEFRKDRQALPHAQIRFQELMDKPFLPRKDLGYH